MWLYSRVCYCPKGVKLLLCKGDPTYIPDIHIKGVVVEDLTDLSSITKKGCTLKLPEGPRKENVDFRKHLPCLIGLSFHL